MTGLQLSDESILALETARDRQRRGQPPPPEPVNPNRLPEGSIVLSAGEGGRHAPGGDPPRDEGLDPMTQIYAPGTAPTGRASTPGHLLTPQAQGVPDDPVALLPACTPCAVCGQAAPKPNGTNGRVQIDVAKDASPAASDLRLTSLVPHPL